MIEDEDEDENDLTPNTRGRSPTVKQEEFTAEGAHLAEESWAGWQP